MQFSSTLKKNHEFRRIYSKGTSAVSPCLVLYCRKNGSGVNRFGITVSAKLGHAVKRNRVRRRIKEIYRLNEGSLRLGYDLIIVSRSKGIRAGYRTLETEFLCLAGKLGLLR